MAERIISEETINAFREYLVLEEKSTATVEKYLRDVSAFRLFAGRQAMTKELTKSEYLRLLKAAKNRPQLHLILETI